MIVELILDGVASFDMDLITCLSPDYSKMEMGWILQQKICSCLEIIPTCCEEGWKLVLAGGGIPESGFNILDDLLIIIKFAGHTNSVKNCYEFNLSS